MAQVAGEEAPVADQFDSAVRGAGSGWRGGEIAVSVRGADPFSLRFALDGSGRPVFRLEWSRRVGLDEVSFHVFRDLRREDNEITLPIEFKKPLLVQFAN